MTSFGCGELACYILTELFQRRFGEGLTSKDFTRFSLASFLSLNALVDAYKDKSIFLRIF